MTSPHLMRALILALLLAATPASATWVGTWAASQQIPEDRNALPTADLTDATLRQVVRVSTGGKSLRVLLTNAFGTEPLRIDAAHIALAESPGSAKIRPGGHALAFDGNPHVTIPAGAAYWSDPVPMAVAPLTPLTVTMHLPTAPARQTSHPGSRSTSYLVHGNRTADADLPDAKKIDHWYQLAAIAVDTPKRATAIVALGDSITDGNGATTNGNNRWPDRLADRLQKSPAHKSIGVLNLGTGGNRLLQDGLGPNALARFDRDVLAQPGVRHLILLEGINDLGGLTRTAPATAEAHSDLVARIIGVYRQIVLRARAAGIQVHGATILPDGTSSYYHPDALNEADRQAVNAFIRAPGNFDSVIDFDAVTRDPADPRRLLPLYDSGDGLHPSVAGYQAMADAIKLTIFK